MNQFAEQAQQMARMWTDLATKMAVAAMAAGAPPASTASPPDTAREMRDAMFGAMASYAEQFMRSPAFVEMMRQSMDAALTLRQQFNEGLTRMHHSLQGVARTDMDAVMLGVRHLEQRVLDGFEAVMDRLDQLASRLDALEGKQPGTGHAGNGAGGSGEAPAGPAARRAARAAAREASERGRGG